MLVSHLPADSASAQTLRDGDSWDANEHLLAVIADRLGEVAWVTAQVNSTKPVERFYDPIPRPGLKTRSNGHQPDHKAKREHASIADLKRFFGQPAGR